MKMMIRKYTSADHRHRVEVHQKKDDLWEIEGYRQVTETLPETGTYTFMEPFLGQSLTDTAASAEKIALETLSALCGVPEDELDYEYAEVENEIPDRILGQGSSDLHRLNPDFTANDPQFKDMISWGVDKDYTPLKNPGIEIRDLTPRVQKVLEKITIGGKSEYSVEVCEMLILTGKSLAKMGRPVDACRFWYNASELSNNPWLGGWGTVVMEHLRETIRKEGIQDNQYQILCPAADLFREYLALSKS